MSDIMKLLLTRRSVSARMMAEPGPEGEVLAAILTAGARVPDHGKLAPWRFIIFEGKARQDFGDILASAFQRTRPDATQAQIDAEAARFTRAPLVIAVISSVRKDVPIPEWEQILSSGAVCQNMLVAATALGFASQWITEWYAYDKHVCAALGLAENERVAGFVYLGTATERPEERKRPEMNEIVTRWAGR
jgi:nitroreductase